MGERGEGRGRGDYYVFVQETLFLEGFAEVFAEFFVVGEAAGGVCGCGGGGDVFGHLLGWGRGWMVEG